MLSLWLLVALVVAPVVASYVFYYFRLPAGRVNYGELLTPVPLPDASLTLADGTPFRLSSLRGRWILASLDSGECDEYCERKLVYLRQLRLTQGKEMDRVERAWIVTDDAAPRAAVVDAVAGTRVIRAAGSGLPARFPGGAAAHDYIYVIDPLGNVMMRFPRDPDPKRMIKDLSRLLKASRIG